jgi:hypothetical protein
VQLDAVLVSASRLDYNFLKRSRQRAAARNACNEKYGQSLWKCGNRQGMTWTSSNLHALLMLRQPMQPSTEALKRIDLRVASASNCVLKVSGAQKQATKRKTTKTMTLAATEMV